ncbi:hypothetical protein L596_014312 [Steinernema carpocapsae]|uniref:Anaphase-promoting complex subunit 10 n=1 Tax=Steinernema carpocapsae TaxID=34508 RepID=A0A4U5NCN4_STECR|nr:hypothetical protein L596_014312 [Steinernema carpocapsae]
MDNEDVLNDELDDEEELEEMDDGEVDGVMVNSNAHDSALMSSSAGTALHWNKVIPDDSPEVRDISLTGTWTLSSSPDGYGINQLLDEQVDQYWQSDGPQPHQITIEFATRTDVMFVLLYLDFKTDESYTPSKVSIQLGSSILDLDEGKVFNFHEPTGWQLLDLRDSSEAKKPAHCFVLQLQVIQNHQNGRDTHIRNMKIIGPGRSGLYDPEEGLLAQREYYKQGLQVANKKPEETTGWEFVEPHSSASFGFGLSLR